MSLLSRLADQLIFAATRDKIDPESRQRELIGVEQLFGKNAPNTGPDKQKDFIEAWRYRFSAVPSTNSDSKSVWAGLKFPGTGGRAERGGSHPSDLLSHQPSETWTINPPGYGGSPGKPSMKNMAPTCEASWAKFSTHHDEVKKMVVGNSLGSMYALYVAARHPIDGLFLRNPVPLKEYIVGAYSRWNFGLGAKMIARQIPSEMDAIENARRCTAPAFFVMSEMDMLIPPSYQQQIIDAYAGRKTVFVATGCDHHHPIAEDQYESYEQSIRDFFAS